MIRYVYYGITDSPPKERLDVEKLNPIVVGKGYHEDGISPYCLSLKCTQFKSFYTGSVSGFGCRTMYVGVIQYVVHGYDTVFRDTIVYQIIFFLEK